jgi:dihydrofolate reductase
MRKLKLQMAVSLDGKWDDEMTDFSLDNLRNVDNILLGRKTAEGFIPYWADVARNPKGRSYKKDNMYKLGKPLTDIPKVVFSKKLKTSKWDNATIIKGDMAKEIKKLRRKKGKDIIVYGGNSFVSSLVRLGLIDEFYLLMNPATAGSGKAAFNPLKNNSQLTLKKSKLFPSGAVLLYYTR